MTMTVGNTTTWLLLVIVISCKGIMSSSEVVSIDDLRTGEAEDLLDRPALAAFLHKVVKLDLLEASEEVFFEAITEDFDPELELELLNSSWDAFVLWNGIGEGIGVGIGEGNSLMGDKHLLKLKPGTSKVMVGAAPAAADTSGSRSFLGLSGSRTSTMILDDDLVGDIDGDEEADAPPKSLEDIFLTSLCCSLVLGLKKREFDIFSNYVSLTQLRTYKLYVT